jgi:carbamoyl-phosphate synthase large subunit
MKKRRIRVLVTGAGNGSSANLMRALRTMTPKPYLVGINEDRFLLKLSLADRNYLCPEPAAADFIASLKEVVRRERIDVIMPTNDNAVKALSDGRRRLPMNLLLPSAETIDLCQDKYALNVFFRRHGIPAPITYEVKSLKNLESIFAKFSRRGLLWCRARGGSRSLAAIPVATVEQARAWITQWRDLRGVKVSDFTLSEYLPGRHFIIQSVWHDGRLLRAQPVEVLSYFAAGNNPSGTFSMSVLAKSVAVPEAVEITVKALQALEERPSGAFCVELKEAADGTPSITEINAGRFPAGVTALLALGKDNMIRAFALSCIGQPVKIAEPYGSAKEYYFMRDIDGIPAVFTEDELSKGYSRIAMPRGAK